MTGNRPPPTPPPDDEPTEIPTTGLGPPSGQDGPPEPPSEFLTPVHGYETIDPAPDPTWPASDAPSSPPPSRRRGTGIGAAVIAVVLVAAGLVWIVDERSSTGSLEAPPDLTATARVCAAPTCERIEASVSLTWSAPDSDVDAYQVVRSTRVVETVPADVTEYDMANLHIDRTYIVGVRAVVGRRTGPTSTIEVRTPTPPLEEAQLTGSYRVRETVRSSMNLAAVEGIENPRPGSSAMNAWSFVALCEEQAGACATRWFSWGPLRNAGVSYDGTFRGRPATCDRGGRSLTTIEMHLVARSGTAVEDRWLVDRFQGTMRVGFTCPGGGRSTGALRVQGRIAS